MRKRDEKILQKLVSRFDARWQKQAEKVVKRLYEQMKNGVPATKAVDNLRKEYSELFKLDGLQDMMTEAACYGYGIIPSVLAREQKQAWGKELARAWDSSGMTLSEKIHGAGAKMWGEIIRTLQTQTQNNQCWMKAARALYDGYSKGKNAFTGGKDIIRQQEIPKYIRKVLLATNDAKTAAAQRQTLDKINRLASGGAPNKTLQAAYNELLESVKDGNEKAIQKAIQTAVNERSRYVAERIARTEMARAYADGFVAKINHDDDIVAVKFKLSGRHPTFDICDMYAKADMYNLGAGVYPKDKLPPLPVHPHCLCRYSEVYTGEVDTTKEKPRIREAGDKWLAGLTEYQRQKVLGVDGLKAWKSGRDWKPYLRGYVKLEKQESRLSDIIKKNMAPPTDDDIKAIAENRGKAYTIGRTGEDRFYDDNGDPICPLNNGVIGEEKRVILPKGYIVSRFGRNTGAHASPAGTPIEARSLDKETREKNDLHTFMLKKDVVCYKGVTAPWFNQKGGGIQYRFLGSMQELMNRDEIVEC